MRISDQSTDYIDHKVGHAAVSGMFDLRDILQLVIDGLD
jgi:hypothetical protein